MLAGERSRFRLDGSACSVKVEPSLEAPIREVVVGGLVPAIVAALLVLGLVTGAVLLGVFIASGGRDE